MSMLDFQETSPASQAPTNEHLKPRRHILVYAPLAVAVVLILLPHPSFIIMSSSHYLITLQSPVTFCVHVLAVYLLTFMVLSSLMACVVRDPGPVTPPPSSKAGSTLGTAEIDATTTLLAGEESSVDELTGTGRWCGQCELHRPERAHHCSSCDRCVLKMDHHCPWLGGNCVGYHTYPSFLHFLASITLLAGYITGVALSVMVHLLSDPFSADPRVTPLHSLFLVAMGAIFTLTIGSFLLYHVYLVSTNQTTLEHMSPFLLLRLLPVILEPASSIPTPSHAPFESARIPLYPPPISSSRARPTVTITFAVPPSPPPLTSPLSQSPTTHTYALYPTPPYSAKSPSSLTHRGAYLEEHRLTPAQRRLVQHTHGRLRPYDVGLRANWAQVFGGAQRQLAHWVYLVLWGGVPGGDGRTFLRGPAVQAGLERLVHGLEDIRWQEAGGRGH